MKIIKTFILTIFFIIFLPGLFTSIWAVNEIRKKYFIKITNIKSPFYTSGDDCFLTEYCKKIILVVQEQKMKNYLIVLMLN